jgi:catechol 2,3-dioxygenase-like lactoylglutathione lyase family enzyme
MPGRLLKVFGYQDNNLNLPVANVDEAIPFYQSVLGFRVVSRAAIPHRSVVLARDDVQMGLAENGGDSSQDGCAFHVHDLRALLGEFQSRGFRKDVSELNTEEHDGTTWQVFYVIAPDGLCYWFGEQQPS